MCVTGVHCVGLTLSPPASSRCPRMAPAPPTKAAPRVDSTKHILDAAAPAAGTLRPIHTCKFAAERGESTAARVKFTAERVESTAELVDGLV
eukprot:45325-Prorocentrum_minimum.AAC.1